MKPRTIYLHFNKPGSKKGLPWTIHMSGKCIAAKKVVVRTSCETVFKPQKKTNPRAFIKVKGRLVERKPKEWDII